MANYRQGDVYFIAVSEGTAGAKEAAEERRVVALGEVTGHRHEVFGGRMLVQGNDLYVESSQEDPAWMMHLTEQDEETGEHTRIDLAPGVYHIPIQRQYEPGGWRNVAD